MEKRPVVVGGGGRKFWIILLSIFVVVAVGLGMAIFLVRINSDGGGEAGDETSVVDVAAITKSTNAALRVCDGIENDFLNGKITFNDTKKKFAETFEDGDDIYKVHLAMCYANFTYKYTKNIDLAVEAIKKAETLANNGVETRSYYAALRNLYYRNGDNEKAEEVNKVLSDMYGSSGEDSDDEVVEGDQE